MRSSPKNSAQQQLYNWLFVLVVTLTLLFVMVMSNAQGYKQFENTFFQKNFLIGNFNRLRIKIGDKVFPNVLIGKDGWMEYTGGGNLDDYQNAENFSPEVLQSIAQTIKGCYQYAQAQDISFLMVVAPNKASIYPDKLPEQLQPLSESSRLDQLNGYLQKQGIPEVLDLRLPLRKARQQHDVYYKTDTHWNGYGAYIAYQEIINALLQNHPVLQVYPQKFFRIREIPPKQGQAQPLAKAMQVNFILETQILPTRNMSDTVYRLDFPDIYGYHEISRISNSQLPSLLIFHDSFGYSYLDDMLALNFSQASYIHRSSSYLYFNQRTIEQLAPNIIIYEVVERDLDAIQKDLLGCALK